MQNILEPRMQEIGHFVLWCISGKKRSRRADFVFDPGQGELDMITASAQAAVMPAPQPASGHSDVAPSDIAVGVIIGRASEYFDFFVYGLASVLVFPSLFFPFADPLTGILYSFAIFALAFIARPFGTALFMNIQRRWGRSAKLTIALFLLGTATAGIAFLPTHASIGSVAILLLALFRILQ